MANELKVEQEAAEAMAAVIIAASKRKAEGTFLTGDDMWTATRAALLAALPHFQALVLAEREACAKVAEDRAQLLAGLDGEFARHRHSEACLIAAEIRERGE